MNKRKFKKLLKKVWYFIWEDNSVWSWIVNIILAFVLIKFIVYPGLGLILNTSHPVVAVVSTSMEHNMKFEDWWNARKDWYIENGIGKKEFEKFPLKDGFNKGDIMVLIGEEPEQIEVGDVIVFISHRERPRNDPIIHRVVNKIENNAHVVLETKGDNNQGQIRGCDGNGCTDEMDILEEQLIGKAILRVPLLGYIKIWFVEMLKLVGFAK